MSTDVGEIDALHTEAHILWNIPNYFSQQKADFYYNSPFFHFLGTKWSLRIYPNGQRINQSVEYVGLYLNREEAYEEHDIYFEISIVRGDGHLCKGCSKYYSNQTNQFGWEKFMERRVILSNKFLIAPEGVLTIEFLGKPVCNTAVDKETQTKILNGMNGLSQDFQKLLSSEQAADVEIRVKSRLFRAHKQILTARSLVFAAMFKHEMKEKNTGLVKIEDCDPFAFKEFLSFMYTGKIDNLSSENVIDIFCLANKYNLSDLNQICIDFMEENLCLNMVCDVLSIADKFNSVKLKKSAKELFVKNMKSIMSTENWIHFIRENPTLATEILMTSL